MRTRVIGDELPMLELLRNAPYGRGFRVMTAAEVITALEIATAHESDSIVFDIGLPRLDGFELM